jgi:calpain-15
VAGHTYSILKVKAVYSHKLIQIRNIWGYFNWDGAWSKKSHFWTQDIQKVLKPKLNEDDGTFWMSWEDFNAHFSQINVTKTRESEEIRVKGQFLRLKDEDEAPLDRVVSKWFYCLNLEQNTNLQMGIHQVDEKIKGVALRRNYLDTGFVVMKRTHDGTTIEGSQEFIHGRDCEYELNLEPGQYVVLPQTNGIGLNHQSSEEEEPVKLVNEDGSLTDISKGMVEDIFYRFDTMISNSIDVDEFNDMWEQLGNVKMTAAEFQTKVLDPHCSTGRGLTCKGLKTFFASQFSELSTEEAYKQLANIGYDQQLYSSFSRSFILSLHSDKAIEVQLGDAVSTNLDDAAVILNLEKNGHSRSNQPEVSLQCTPHE